MDVRSLAVELLAQAPPGPALVVARESLGDAGFDVTLREEEGVLLARRGEGGVVFSGHLDVVPAGEGWTRPPFGTKFVRDRLYARGASDMRGPVACMLAALGATAVPASVVLTSDEETSMASARALVREGLVARAPLVVVGEPTELQVATCGKGVAWVRVTVEAPQGHASAPRGSARGASAPERLVEVLSKLPSEPVRAAHPLLGSSTAALTGLATGDGPYNVLPKSAEARIDCRFPAPLAPDAVLDAVIRALGLPAMGVRVDLDKREPPFEGDAAMGEKVAALLSAAGLPSRTCGVHFASEAGHWAPQAPTIVCGPGSIARAHGPDEFITADELERGVCAYAAIAERFARP